MRYKVIRNYNDANKLLALGHRILKIDRDKNNMAVVLKIYYMGQKINIILNA